MANATQWEASLPQTITGDPLWNIRAYRLALRLADEAWGDVSLLAKDLRTAALANQLYKAVGSISANIGEGYSRGSPRERAHFYEYALGSAREARDWYFKARHSLESERASQRLDALTDVIRLLLVMIPQQRGTVLHDAWPEYAPSED